MARIAYGVMGDAGGHTTRALAIARALAKHEFLFFGGGKALELRQFGYHVEEVPMLATYYSNNKVNVRSTLANGLKVLGLRSRFVEKVAQTLQEFRADLVLTDYEYFSARAARRLGIPCISIDNQHFLTKCVWRPHEGQTLGRFLLTVPLRLLFSVADRFIISTFFRLAPINPEDTEVFPPVLRHIVSEFVPSQDEHVLVYQTSPTFLKLLSVLERLPYRFLIYGFGDRPSSGNLVFKSPSTMGFLQDLSSCRYAITNGGHNVISEALYYGKPVLAFPIRLAYEQFFNGHMLRTLGYGDYCLDSAPDGKVFRDFEERLEGFRSRVSQGNFYGNDQLASRLEQILSGAPADRPRS